MEKSDSLKLAHELVVALVSAGQLGLNLDKNNSPTEILSMLENMARGILKIEEKL